MASKSDVEITRNQALRLVGLYREQMREIAGMLQKAETLLEKAHGKTPEDATEIGRGKAQLMIARISAEVWGLDRSNSDA